MVTSSEAVNSAQPVRDQTRYLSKEEKGWLTILLVLVVSLWCHKGWPGEHGDQCYSARGNL